jgi:hypothetical protein
MTQQVQMTQWAVVYATEDPFQAPEQASLALKGIVTGHPRKPDGSVIRTSGIAKAQGRVITTESGTVYRLGEPSEAYRAWLAEHRPNWDPENPIAMLGG